MARVRIGDVAALASAHRHVLTLRHTHTEETHDVLLFRMASAAPMFYCMEARCPHLGASLERAPLRPGLDDVEDLIVVCPYVRASDRRWHVRAPYSRSNTTLGSGPVPRRRACGRVCTPSRSTQAW